MPEGLLLTGDALAMLRTLPDDSVHCSVTSPPYWGLRDYGVEGQLGLEATPEAYVAALVAVFAEVRRVLRPDGTLWLNLGDSYTSSGRGGIGDKSTLDGGRRNQNESRAELVASPAKRRKRAHGKGAGYEEAAVASAHVAAPGLRPKNLVGIPWRVAFALQASGWNLRADIIWAKPNPMPESVLDRPTRAHEYLFLLSKSERYYYDADAIKEPSVKHASGNALRQHRRDHGGVAGTQRGNQGCAFPWEGASRNVRSVWTLGSEPFPDAHFATFPEALPKRCILAGTSDRGACAVCGAPYTRVLDERPAPRVRTAVPRSDRDGGLTAEHGMERTGMSHRAYAEWLAAHPRKTLGWQPGCVCPTTKVAPCVVLDPFAGAGTTLVVADAHQRAWIGIELNPGYAEMARRRVGARGAPLFSTR